MAAWPHLLRQHSKGSNRRASCEEHAKSSIRRAHGKEGGRILISGHALCSGSENERFRVANLFWLLAIGYWLLAIDYGLLGILQTRKWGFLGVPVSDIVFFGSASNGKGGSIF